MKNRALPDGKVNAVADMATLGGVILGIDAVVQAAKNAETVGPVLWALFGFFVSFVSAASIASRLLDKAGNWENHQTRRLAIGGVVLIQFLVFGLMIVQFRQ